jgi:hypothetical protein
VARSYHTRGNVKNDQDRRGQAHRVHPVLAAKLAQWRLAGWPEMMGRAPGPGDLIVPLSPDAAERHRSRHGEPYRSTTTRAHDGATTTCRCWDGGIGGTTTCGRHHACHRGWRRPRCDRDSCDAQPEGAQRIRRHNRGLHWERTCGEILKLRITRGPRSSPIARPIAISGESDQLHFRCSLCKLQKLQRKSGLLRMQPRRQTRGDGVKPWRFKVHSKLDGGDPDLRDASAPRHSRDRRVG